MKTALLLISSLFLTAVSIAQPGETGLVRIDVNRPGLPGTAGEMLRVAGFTLLLDSSGSEVNHPVTQLLYGRNEIYLLDSYPRDGLERLDAFDRQTGRLLRRRMLGGDDRPGYIDHMRMAFRPDGQGITVLGGEEFHDLDWNGRETGVRPTGIYGYDMVNLDQEKTALFTQSNPSKISGPYHLLIVDREGRLEKRLAFYPPNREMGLGHTGFLSRSDQTTWFARPLGDTIYQLTSALELAPRYYLNFEGRQVPEIVREADRHLAFDEWSEHAFVGRHFVKTGNLIIFEFKNAQANRMAVFDAATGQLATSERALEGDPMDVLLRSAAYFSEKDASSVAFLYNPATAAHYLDKFPGLQDGLDRLYPGLGDAFQRSAAGRFPLIVYLSAR